MVLLARVQQQLSDLELFCPIGEHEVRAAAHRQPNQGAHAPSPRRTGPRLRQEVNGPIVLQS
jgi:hypothetical protein